MLGGATHSMALSVSSQHLDDDVVGSCLTVLADEGTIARGAETAHAVFARHEVGVQLYALWRQMPAVEVDRDRDTRHTRLAGEDIESDDVVLMRRLPSHREEARLTPRGGRFSDLRRTGLDTRVAEAARVGSDRPGLVGVVDILAVVTLVARALTAGGQAVTHTVTVDVRLHESSWIARVRGIRAIRRQALRRITVVADVAHAVEVSIRLVLVGRRRTIVAGVAQCVATGIRGCLVSH